MFLSEEPSKSSISNKSFEINNLLNKSSDEIQTFNVLDDPLKGKMGNFLKQQQQKDLRKSQRTSFQNKFPLNQLNRTSIINKLELQLKDDEHSQQMQLIENYLGYHNKFKTYFKSKKFKKIYNELVKQMPLEKSYYAMYMIDKLFSLNKHIKVSLVHKETSFIDYLKPYFDSGKKLIPEFYKFFLVDDQLHKATKKVSIQAANGGSSLKSCNSNQFFYIIITFLLQSSIFYRSKNMRKQAQTYYECNLKLIFKILSSSTSNSKIRRKICQYLISFGSFLIESRQLIKAKKILEMALNNCINLIGINESKLRFSQFSKNKSNISDYVFEKYKKRINLKLIEAFQFMIAIYLNIAVLYELQNKQYLSFVALNQVKCIQQILYKNYFIKSRIPEVIKKPKQAFDSYNEKLHVIKKYFDMQKILTTIKDEQEMNLNPHIGIYGSKKVDENSQNNKSVMEMFFKQSTKKKESQKQRSEFFTNKIALIQYDSQIDFEQRQRDRDHQSALFQYTITTKNANGSQSTSIYNHVRSPNQKRALTSKISEGQRREGKKLSKFCNQQITNQKEQKIRETKKSSTIFEPQTTKQSKKNHRNFTYNSIKSSKISVESFQKSGSIKQGEKQTDFLDQLIDSEVQNKNYFLYGKDFVQKYDQLSKGKTIHEKKQIKYHSPSFQPNNRKEIQYNGKRQIQILKQKQNSPKYYNSVLFNKTEEPRYHSKSYGRQKNLSKNIVKNEKDIYLDCKEINQNISEKKKHSKSVKVEPMSYKQVVKSIEKTHIKFMRTDLIDKNSIYRLKCRSQITSKSSQAIRSVSGNPLTKTSSNFGLLDSIKKQDEQQGLISKKFQKKDKLFRSLNAQGKSTNLSKKALNSNLFGSNETGIRLLKKIIFKHKKALKISKPDLFLNYNKKQTQQQEIKLVQRQSYLIVQYQMCEQQTKARIKQNMQQLIVDNIRKSQQHQKRAERINKAIDDHSKSNRINNLSARIDQEFHNAEKAIDNARMKLNTNHISANSNQSSTDQIVKQIFKQRILMNSNEKDDLGLQEDKFLTGNKINNPNLFLSSIKFKQQKKGNKKIRTLKNINNLWVKPDSEEDQSSYNENYTKNANQIYSGNTSNSFGEGQIQENSNLLSDNWL